MIFIPPSATWINCANFTYHPHSNECGLRTILASIVFAFHPSPSQTMLLPFMHPNIAQILRWWVSSILISNKFQLEKFSHHFFQTPRQQKILTTWTCSTLTLMVFLYPKQFLQILLLRSLLLTQKFLYMTSPSQLPLQWPLQKIPCHRGLIPQPICQKKLLNGPPSVLSFPMFQINFDKSLHYSTD